MKQLVGIKFVGDDLSTQWDSDIYYYEVNGNIPLEVEDRVYIKTNYKENLAKVCEIILEEDTDDFEAVKHELHARTPLRFLKIDLSEILKAEAKYKKLRELEKAMDKKVKSIERIQKYEILKEYDPDFAQVFEEYKNLFNEIQDVNLIEAPRSQNNINEK